MNIYNLLFGIVDICFFLMIVFPLYPNTIDGYIYSVNLFAYRETTSFNYFVYWTMYVSLIVLGMIKLLLTKFKMEKRQGIVTDISIGLNILAVIFLALTREAYAITMAFILLLIKGVLLIKSIKFSGK